MDIVEERRNNVVVIKLAGRLDASSVKTFKEKISTLIKESCFNLVLDIGDVSFIDSSGLGSLVAGLRSVHSQGGDIRIAVLKDELRAIFELTRLHRVFQIFDDIETAVESFG